MNPVYNSRLPLTNDYESTLKQYRSNNNTFCNSSTLFPLSDFTLPIPPSCQNQFHNFDNNNNFSFQPMTNHGIQHVTIPSDDIINAAKKVWFERKVWQNQQPNDNIPILSISHPEGENRPYLLCKKWIRLRPFPSSFILHLQDLEIMKNVKTLNSHFHAYLINTSTKENEQNSSISFTNYRSDRYIKYTKSADCIDVFKFNSNKPFDVALQWNMRVTNHFNILFVLPILINSEIKYASVLSDPIALVSNVESINDALIGLAWDGDWKISKKSLISWEYHAKPYARRIFENATKDVIRKLSCEDFDFLHSELEKIRKEKMPTNDLNNTDNTRDNIYTKAVFTQWANWVSLCLSIIEENGLQSDWALKPTLADNSVSPHYLVRGFINVQDTEQLLSHPNCKVNTCIVRLPPFEKTVKKVIIFSRKVDTANAQDPKVIHYSIPFVGTSEHDLLNTLVGTVDHSGQRLFTQIYLSESCYLPLNTFSAKIECPNGLHQILNVFKSKTLLLDLTTLTKRGHSHSNPNIASKEENEVTHREKKLKFTNYTFNNNNIDNDNNNIDDIDIDNDGNNINKYNLFDYDESKYDLT